MVSTLTTVSGRKRWRHAAFLFATALGPLLLQPSLWAADSEAAAAKAMAASNLVDPQLLGWVEGYALVAGRPCRDCQNDRVVSMVKPDGTQKSQFVFPGKILDPKNRQTLHESRAFFGKCLNTASLPEGDVYVMFQKDRGERRRGLQPSVFVARPGDEFIQERLIERRLPRLDRTLKLVKRRTCQEIPGQTRLMMRQRIDVTPKRLQSPEADEDDEREEEVAPATGAPVSAGDSGGELKHVTSDTE